MEHESKLGPLIGGVLNASSSLSWATQGYGRRMVFFFEEGMLVLETNLRGKPSGDKDQLRALGETWFQDLSDHIDEFAALDPRNLVIPAREVAHTRLSSPKKAVLRLDLTLGSGETETFLFSPRQTYRRMAPDGGLPIPKDAYKAAVADIEKVFGSRLSE
jgi:hypothetical protein